MIFSFSYFINQDLINWIKRIFILIILFFTIQSSFCQNKSANSQKKANAEDRSELLKSNLEFLRNKSFVYDNGSAKITLNFGYSGNGGYYKLHSYALEKILGPQKSDPCPFTFKPINGSSNKIALIIKCPEEESSEDELIINRSQKQLTSTSHSQNGKKMVYKEIN